MTVAVFAAALALLGCGQECGGGTIEQDGKCVPSYEEVTCAPGTRLSPAGCVPDLATLCGAGTIASLGRCLPASVLVCGPGTQQIEDSCVPKEASLTCGEGTVVRDGVCVSLATVPVLLPFAAGTSVPVTQSYHGWSSHHDTERYAIDFGVAVDTPIAAARAGRVLAARGDSSSGCGDSSCAALANYVVVDHGDGTFGLYWHLRQGGLAVAIGDQVCRGQVLGYSGNTGFSTGPHLHFAVVDLWQETLPLYFEDVPASKGIVYQGGTFVSNNVAPQGACTETHAYSSCPTDTYLTRGIRLDPGAPCVVTALGSSYTVSGEVLLATPYVQLGRYQASTDTWAFDCLPVAQGRFSAEVSWPAPQYSGYSLVMWSAARADSTASACPPYEGWSIAPKIYLQ